MPGIELHADFDRDGRLTRSAAERAARTSWPGAVVVPNLDRDRRTLPASVSDARLLESDFELASALTGDDELVPLEVVAIPGALAAGDTLHLRCSGVMHTRVSLADSTGRVVPHRLRAPDIYELPPMSPAGTLSLTLQVRTIAGAAWDRSSSTSQTMPVDVREESRFTLTLLRRDAGGNEQDEDVGHFSVAPFILVDRLAPVRRIYVIRGSKNLPSLEDLRRATRAAAVPLVEIDEALTGGDTWIQDQYQHAMMQGPGGWRELILHLPRMRNDSSSETITRNLEGVVNGHFRSRDVGLFRDLWDRVVPVRAEDGTVARPTFRDLDAWMKRVNRLERVAETFNRYGYDADQQRWRPILVLDWIEFLRTLDDELARLNTTLDTARRDASGQRLRQLDAEKEDAQRLSNEAKAQFRLIRRLGGPTVESELAGRRVRLTVSTARELFDRADQMHASQNYGGNFESTPPTRTAPFGAIILGNATERETYNEAVDPDLLRVFAKQRKQPIIEVDPTWLRVGHVDEMLAVVPSARASGSFAVLHASSKAAVELLEEARTVHLLGLSIADPMRDLPRQGPSGILQRVMIDGSAPVTRLFRGKAWLHTHPRLEERITTPKIDPPDIYYRLCYAMGTTAGHTGYSVHRIGYVPGQGPDRHYPADITPIEVLWTERDSKGMSSNREYDERLLEPSRSILRRELDGAPILPVPVLFDRMHDVGRLRRGETFQPTTAFTPDMVNMQVLNGHLVVPKPYGPRMRVDDAVAVVRAAMTEVQMPDDIKSRVGRRLIAARRMTRGEYWVERVHPALVLSGSGTIVESYGGMETKDDVTAVFRDSFPTADAAERERRIIQPHLRHFDAQGWLKNDFSLFRFDDGMVDLFELWMAAIAAHLGVRLHFVDSWFYHLHDGQIHCGTNVLHRPPPSTLRLPNVWDSADHLFRTRTIEFPDEDVVQ